MNFKHLTIEDFLKNLASKQPLPAGGSASAICGAMGAALACMTAKRALEKWGYENRSDELEKIVKISEKLIESLVNLSEKDFEANNKVHEALLLSKNISSGKKFRVESLEKAYKEAAAVHLEILNAAEDLMEIAILPVKHGNPDAITDATAGAYMAWAAAGIAAMNIRSNISCIHDAGFTNKIASETEFTLERVQSLSEAAEKLLTKFLEP